MRHAVHRLAVRDSDLFLLSPILILPGGDEKQTTFCTECDALGRGVITVRETVVGDHHDRETVMNAGIKDVLLAGSDAGREQHRALLGGFEAAGLLVGKATLVTTVTDHGEQLPLKERTIAVGVAVDLPAIEKETTRNLRQGIRGDEVLWTLALQEATESGRCQGGIDAAPPWLQAVAVVGTQPSAAGVVKDIGALRF